MEQKRWWVLYPVKGLEINNEVNGFDKPLFGDVTIISKTEIGKIIQKLKLNKKVSKGHDHEADVMYMMENITFKEDFHSFLAVRRTGLKDDIKNDASKRAYSVLGLISLVFLAVSSSGKTCGFVEQLNRNIKSVAMIDTDNGEFALEIKGGLSFTILDSRNCIKVSSEDLIRTLYDDKFKDLTEALLPIKSPISTSLKNILNQATIRLSDAVHSITPSGQLLGAVTSIEILLSIHGDSYKVNKNRLIALLGSDSIERFNVEKVLNARHKYVHEGREIEDYTISKQAIGLALSTIFKYSELTKSYRSKEEIINYLDFIYQSEKLKGGWNDYESDCFRGLLKHKREGYSFPFLD
jgi:hypothetical protein